MPDSVPTGATEFIETQLHERLRTIEDNFDADAVCIISSIFNGIDDVIRTLLEQRKVQKNSKNRLIVLLTTNGGSIEVVHHIVETMRYHYDYVAFAIPNYAYSAGTVLAMSGDDIYMDYYSRLGPIDPQVRNSRGRWVPALGYLEQYKRIMDKAKRGKINVAEAHLLVNGFDQAELYQFEQARELSITFLKEWLVNYKFKNWTVTETTGKAVTDSLRQRRARDIAAALNETKRWHSHGHGISMQVLREELKLRINDLQDEPEKDKATKEYDRLLSDFMGVTGQRIALHTVGTYIGYRAPEE
jgi:hypothetical protein